MPLPKVKRRSYSLSLFKWKVKITMEKVEVAYSINDELIKSIAKPKPESFVLKSIAASFAGASIPAAIFYFLM